MIRHVTRNTSKLIIGTYIISLLKNISKYKGNLSKYYTPNKTKNNSEVE